MRNAIRSTIVGTLAASAALAPASAGAESAPDLGRAFEPTPVSQPLYGVKSPAEDPARQRTFLEAADGVDLYLETWLPKAKDGNVPPARVPTIYQVSPYLRQNVVDPLMPAFVERGYAWSQLHVRGTGESGGCIEDHTPQEVEDGLRALDYIARTAPWSNGDVGGLGFSYPGGSIFSLAASGDPRALPLKAMIVGAPVATRYDGVAMDGVPQILEGQLRPAVWFGLSRPGATATPQRIAERPGCYGTHVKQGYVDEPSGDFTPYFAEREHRDGSHLVQAATFMFHGLQDLDVQPNMQSGLFDRITAPKHGMFGVFGHESPGDHYLTNLRREWERADIVEMGVAWFDQYLKGLPAGADKWPVVEVQGSDGQWRAESEWPLTGGPAGELALGAGGQLGTTTPAGSTDYAELEFESTAVERSDISAAEFTTPPLPERLEITGQVVLDAWVTLDRPDAHLAAAIEAVDAYGHVIEATRDYGARSARHLEPLVDGRFAQAEGKDPATGRPIHVEIRLQPADIVVPKGGRLRLVVAGSVRTGVGLSELVKYTPFGSAPVDPDPLGFAQPSQPSGTATRVTLHHDCDHPTMLRFRLPAEPADLLNVREKDEPTGEPLASNPFEPPVTDGGGIARAPVCGTGP